jgi:hypothetical protein
MSLIGDTTIHVPAERSAVVDSTIRVPSAQSAISDKDFAACVAVGAGLKIQCSVKVAIYQLLYNRASTINIYHNPDNGMWCGTMPQNTLVYILKQNKYMLPKIIRDRLLTSDKIANPHGYYIDMSNDEIVEILMARGYFPWQFFKNNNIMDRAIIAPIRDTVNSQYITESARYYMCKSIILLRAMKNASRDEIINRHEYWESELTFPTTLNAMGEVMRNEFIAIMSKYMYQFYELYPAILFVYYKIYNRTDSDFCIPITISELIRIFEFSTDVDYQNSVSDHLRKYLHKIHSQIKAGVAILILDNYLTEISRIIFDDYPQYIHSALLPRNDALPTFSELISYMPTFYTANITLFITNNIKRCPHLHKFIKNHRISRDDAIEILQNYPVPNNPIAKNVDIIAECIAPGCIARSDVLNYDIMSFYFDMIRNKYCNVYFKTSAKIISAGLSADNISKFKITIAECVAENPQLLSNMGLIDLTIDDEIMNMVGAIQRRKISYIYLLRRLPIDIRHIIAHSFIHRDSNCADDFGRYLHITSDSAM